MERPAEPEQVEIIAVRARIDGQWVGRQLTDDEYDALEDEILELYH